VKTKRTVQRNLDKAQKKELVPLINRVGESANQLRSDEQCA
jgi:hypothetical protein